MMSLTRFRTPTLLVVCGLALVLSSCSSNNKGKIEGKWKMVSTTLNKPEVQQMKQMGLTLSFEFVADGTMKSGVMADKPEAEALVKMMEPQMAKQAKAATYSLGSGDTIYINEGGKKAKTSAKIDGDNMTLTDADGSMTLVRVK